MIAGAAAEVALSRFASPGFWPIALGFLVGLTTYSLYMLSVSLANDGASPHDLIFISVGLLFLYCVAAIASPAISSLLMNHSARRGSSCRTPTSTRRWRRSRCGVGSRSQNERRRP